MKIREIVSKHKGLKFIVSCHMDCNKLVIYAPKLDDNVDDLYEIGDVLGTRSEWADLFKQAGIS